MIQILVSIVLLFFVTIPVMSETFIRMNQVGFLTTDTKTAIVMSTELIEDLSFQVFNSEDSLSYHSDLIFTDHQYAEFKHLYFADFSELVSTGSYSLIIDSTTTIFKIEDNLYHDLTDSLLGFFKFQRCGTSRSPIFPICHPNDATKIIRPHRTIKGIDLTGGWHDAGDYVKFLNTTAVTVYFMLLAAQQYTDYDDPVSQLKAAAILTEAKIGIDWLIKMHLGKKRLITQVQDLRDQNVGWRLPEDDPQAFNRPAYELPSKAHCGIYSAALALAADVYRKSGEKKYAKLCLKHALQVYRLAYQRIPSTSSNADSIYYDNSDWDNLALASIELYRTTGKKRFLKKYLSLIENAPEVHWVSWGDLGGIAFARGIQYSEKGEERLVEILDTFNDQSKNNLFGFPLRRYSWGSASTQAGIALLSLMHYTETGDNEYLDLAIQQRDFILGKNSHGICLIGGFGSDYPTDLHHQVSYLSKLPLTGGFAAGLISRDIFENSNIIISSPDRFSRFHTKDAVYHDDHNDYLCNEATIANNALALLVFSYFDRHNDNQIIYRRKEK